MTWWIKGLVIAIVLVGGVGVRAQAQAPEPIQGAHDIDGIAITEHIDRRGYRHGMDAPGYGNLIRHDIKDRQVIRSMILYRGGDAGIASISPDGRELVFCKSDNSLNIMSINGGEHRRIAQMRSTGDYVRHAPGDPWDPGRMNRPLFKWVAGDGGRWIYYVEELNYDDETTTINRVHADSGEIEHVVTLNLVVWKLDISTYATKNSGRLVTRPIPWRVAFYDLAAGDGDLWAAPFVPKGCGPSVSPDGSLGLANNVEHVMTRVCDTHSGRIIERIDVNAYDPNYANESTMWQMHRWSTNSPHHFIASQGVRREGRRGWVAADAVLYNIKDDWQLHVVDNPHGQYEVACAYWDARQAAAMDLGVHAGEAPFTVNLDANAPDTTRWDFGDGSDAGGKPRHTYTTPGRYTVSATNHGQTRYGHVTVQPRHAPRITHRLVAGDRKVLLEFDETVRVDNPTFELRSGIEVVDHKLDEHARRLELTLARSIEADDAIRIAGVTDRAQQPNALSSDRHELPRPAWPRHSEEAVVLYATPQRAFARRAEGVPFAPLRHNFQGNATIDRFGRFNLIGGSVWTHLQPIDPAGEQGQATVELILQPYEDDSYRRGVQVLSFKSNHQREFELWQNGRGLSFGIDLDNADRSSQWHRLGDLPDLEAHHLAITFDGNRVRAWIDGERCYESDEIDGTLPACGKAVLGLAPVEDDRRRHWVGRIEGVAIHRRALSDDQVKANHQSWRTMAAARPEPAQAHVVAELIEACDVPGPREIEPYTNAIMFNRYRVARVDDAAGLPVEAGDEIRVAQWSILGAENTPARDQRRVGREYPLRLEPWSERPDLHEELTHDTVKFNPDEREFFAQPLP